MNHVPETDSFVYHALVWDKGGSVLTDLNPAGFNSSVAYATLGSTQVGAGRQGEDTYRALLWHGTADSVVDLSPTGWEFSKATGVSARGQVGTGLSQVQTHGYDHALYWNGSAASCIDLNSDDFSSSEGLGIGDDGEVGYGVSITQGMQAILWHESPTNYTVLTPLGYEISRANGAWGHQQVGYASLNYNNHAILWSGSATRAIDLHPDGYSSSEALSIAGNYQVGYVAQIADFSFHAALWQGSSGSMINLENFCDDLPFTVTGSIATGVTEDGDVIGRVYDPSGNEYYVRWNHVVPEPASLTALALGTGAFLRRRQKRSVA